MTHIDLPQGPGAAGFRQEYWERYYGDLSIMDGVYNASQHARYLHSLFELEGVFVGNLVDLGFGLGHLLSEMIEVFLPYRVEGIEPSAYAFRQVSAKRLQRTPQMEVSLFHEDMMSWCGDAARNQLEFDLGLCTSVFQYLSDEEIGYCIPILAQRIKYLYFTVPIDVELDYQTKHLNFNDTYAIPRSRERYHQLFAPGFTVVASRVLESKVFYQEGNSCFNELLYRYG